MRPSRTVRRVAMLTAAGLLATTAAHATPGAIALQVQPGDDETMWRGQSIVGPSDDELDQARDAIADINDEIERAEAELDLVRDELDIVGQRLTIASEQLSIAEEVSWQATDAADAARDQLAAVQRELADARGDEAANRDQLTGFARDAYMFGPSATDPMLMLLDGLSRTDSGDLANAQQAVDVVARDRSKVLEDTQQLVATTAGLEVEAGLLEDARADREAEAQAARDDAASRHAEVLDLLAQTEDQVERQRELVDQLSDDRAAAVDTLEQLEEEVTRAEEAAEAKRQAEEAARRRAEEARRRAEEAAAAERAAAQAAAERAAAEAARAAEAAEAAEAEAAQATEARDERRAMGTVDVSVSGGLASVGGITVSSSIAGQLESLLNAARADGIALGGNGYRSPETTARLRMANGCPDVYTSPSSSCRIPTARPGSSMHEKGLAIDFTWQGQTICYPNSPANCHGNAAFDWLRANAASYGFYGLTSEAWHFSTNGN